MTESCESGGEGTMKHTTNILEELLESEYKGLIYIDEQNRIGSYSKRAKEITGIISEDGRCHAAGSIKEGDIVIICDNEIGNDDALSPADLLHININDKNIAKGDAIVAVGVYHNKKIKPQYKYIKSYSPNGKFELKTNYLGFEIVSRIDFANNSADITVNNETYTMRYFEAVGHMVVIDGITGEIKFFQSRGYGFRGEEIGKLFSGRGYMAKASADENEEDTPAIEGLEIQNVIHGEAFITKIEDMMKKTNGCVEKGIYEIHRRPIFCIFVRVRSLQKQDGVYVIIQDASLLEEMRKERNAIIQLLEERQKKKSHNEDKNREFEIAGLNDFIGRNPSMAEVKRLAYKASQTMFNVIITGESGTGKSRLAKNIHNMGNPGAPFVEVNCNAIAPSLFESELFGYAPGAFTGAATGGKAGFFEEANGGTIFLDEIGEIPPDIQVKLLHVLQNKRIYRVGSSKPIDVNVRVITATNRNLEEEVRQGRFRQDLYYRINVFPICIPPLRQRKDDLYVLINSILSDICVRYDMKPMLLSEEALNKMMRYSWPGNVRELENVIERAITICDSPVIYSEHILIHDDEEEGKTLKEQLLKEEKRIIAETLMRNKGSRQKAMEELGLSKTVFYEKLKKIKF